ncbi:hypothetical protein T492DRAFT_887709 [Pavlovales sp. CCMP2436]|nr:hypothetical protein T492DRAFT_887709 [Pavlovales sp. CCMP2436]
MSGEALCICDIVDFSNLRRKEEVRAVSASVADPYVHVLLSDGSALLVAVGGGAGDTQADTGVDIGAAGTGNGSGQGSGAHAEGGDRQEAEREGEGGALSHEQQAVAEEPLVLDPLVEEDAALYAPTTPTQRTSTQRTLGQTGARKRRRTAQAGAGAGAEEGGRHSGTQAGGVKGVVEGDAVWLRVPICLFRASAFAWLPELLAHDGADDR